MLAMAPPPSRKSRTVPAIHFKFNRWIDSVLMQKALGEVQNTLPK